MQLKLPPTIIVLVPAATAEVSCEQVVTVVAPLS